MRGDATEISPSKGIVMSAEQLLRDGMLDEALVALQDIVRDDPSNAKHRIFLFQILCVMGQWDRALTQLNVAADLDPIALAMAQMYREALRIEVLRADIFAGKRSPLIFGEPPEWISLLIEALRIDAEGNATAAQKLRERAFENAPTTSGTIDDKPFEWIADADTRLGPVLEVLVNGRYYWAPFSNIRQIQLEEPSDLRDIIWTPCQFIWANGGDAVGLIPTRYPSSENNEDPQIRLARKTIWTEPASGASQGCGQRLFATDSDDFSIMDTRKITLECEAIEVSEMAEASNGESPNA